MKRITLNYKHNPDSKPHTFTVVFEHTDGTLDVTAKSMRGCSPLQYTLTPTEYGYKNQNGCEFTVAKRDARRKPFSVAYRSGIGEGSVETKFATLAEVQAYVIKRWQGADYIDGADVFHSDHGHFVLKGCTLADLGQSTFNEEFNCYDWAWRAL